MKMNAGPDDFLRGKLVNPGWHPSKLVAYEEKTSKPPTDPSKAANWAPSTYAEVQFRITDGEFKGVILYSNFSEKAPGMSVPLLEALGQKFDKTKQNAIELTKERLLNKFVDIHVVRGTFNNKPKNEIDGYKEYSGTANQTGSANPIG